MDINQIYKLFASHGPGSWAIIRTVEAYLLKNYNYKSPAIDIGCGDGYFTSILLNLINKNKFDLGIDIDKFEISKAKEINVYNKVELQSILKTEYPNNYFNTVFSNGVLEHIKELDLALIEISRILKRNGVLIFTVPSTYISDYFITSRYPMLNRVYTRLYNRLFNHINLYNHTYWIKILKKHRISIESYKYYNLNNNFLYHDILLPFSLPQIICKRVTKKWVILKNIRKITSIIESSFIYNRLSMATSIKKGPSLLIIAKKL